MNYPDWQPATSRREMSVNLSQHVGWRLYLRRHNTPQVANIAILAHLRAVVKRLFPFFQIYLSRKRTKRRSRSFESLLRLSARNISDHAPPLKIPIQNQIFAFSLNCPSRIRFPLQPLLSAAHREFPPLRCSPHPQPQGAVHRRFPVRSA